MAEIQIAPTSQKQAWYKKAIYQYSRESRFLPFMGPAVAQMSNAANEARMPIIQVYDDLKTENANVINIPLFGKLTGQGVSGSMLLIGNEDDMPNFNAQVATDWIRNGVVVPKSTTYKTDLDLMAAARNQLGAQWLPEKLRDNLIQAMAAVLVPGLPFTDPVTGAVSVGPDGAVNYAVSTPAQRNAYLTNNSDRILFGNATANTVAGNWAASLANISTATGRASTVTFNLAKRLFKKTTTTGNFPMRPYMVPEMGREYVVAFCATNTFRDVANDTAMINANRDARAREGNGMTKNPLFQDGDLEYQGVMYVEFPELDKLTQIGVGNSGSSVDMNFVCGAQSLALAYSQMHRYIVDNKYDYEFRPRVGIEECRGQKKLSYNGTMLGVLPVLTSSVADA